MTKEQTPTELDEAALDDATGGLVNFSGATIATKAAAATTLGSGSVAGGNEQPALETAPAETDYIGGPPTIDKARHSALLSTLQFLR